MNHLKIMAIGLAAIAILAVPLVGHCAEGNSDKVSMGQWIGSINHLICNSAKYQ